MREKRFKKLTTSVFKKKPIARELKDYVTKSSEAIQESKETMAVVHFKFLKSSITFFDKERNVMAIFPLPGGTNHIQRKRIANKLKLKFEFYTLHNFNYGMDKAGTRWFRIDENAKEIPGSVLKIPKF